MKVGTVFQGNTVTVGKASAKITKIVIDGDNSYICYNASKQHIKQVEQENKKRSRKGQIILKPIKSGRLNYQTFLRYIETGTIKILTPNT